MCIYIGTHTPHRESLSAFSSSILLLFPTRRNIFAPKTCFILCKYTLFCSRRVKLITSFTHDYTHSLSLSPTPLFLSPPLSGCVHRPSDKILYIIGAHGETTVDGYESTAIPVGQFLTRRKLRASVINAAVAATATKVIIID